MKPGDCVFKAGHEVRCYGWWWFQYVVVSCPYDPQFRVAHITRLIFDEGNASVEKGVVVVLQEHGLVCIGGLGLPMACEPPVLAKNT